MRGKVQSIVNSIAVFPVKGIVVVSPDFLPFTVKAGINIAPVVTKGVDKKFTLKDELYYYIPDSTGAGVEVLANASAAGSDKIYPSVFVIKHPKARIVGIALGHDAESHDIAPYQNLLRNAVRWVAHK